MTQFLELLAKDDAILSDLAKRLPDGYKRKVKTAAEHIATARTMLEQSILENKDDSLGLRIAYQYILFLENDMGRIAEDLKFYKDQATAAQTALKAEEDAHAVDKTALDAANAQIADLTTQVPDADDKAALDAADAERSAATTPPAA